MRLSLKLLSDYIRVDASPADIASALDAAGFEVESIRRLDEGISGVVVARVIKVEPHPDGDRLRVCTIDHGSGSLAEVVCGAWNFEVGAIVPYAPAGAELPGGLVLGRRKIRGVTSEGMICSEAELALGDEAAGIMVLATDPAGAPPVGTAISEALGLDDIVVEFDITPNRPDAMSVIGLAREVAAAFGVPWTLPKFDVVESGRPSSDSVEIENAAPEKCPRYTARVLDGVKVGTSPEWMVRYLTASGVRSINNVVDATNFVLIETGQPLHAFDLDLLGGSRIVVRRAGEGEAITTLDGVERHLTGEDLVIADTTIPVALAGIMGGENSEILPTTTRVLIESAYFEPKGVLATSKRLGLRTESSARFERGCDPEMAAWASNRAAALIAGATGARVAAGLIDSYPEPIGRRELELRPSRTNWILGTDLEPREQAGHLSSIDLDVTSVSPASIRVTIPTFRPDLEREIDLIEEVGRLHGYGEVTLTLPGSPDRIGRLTRPQHLSRRLSDALRGAGLNEVQTFSFVGPDELLNGAAAVARVANPLRAEESILRPSLLPGLIRVASINVARRRGVIRLFETGKVFGSPDESSVPSETARVAGIITSSGESEESGYLGAKGALEAVFEVLDVYGWTLEPTERPAMHPGRTAQLMIGEAPAGFVAELHPGILELHGLGKRGSVFELDQAALFDAVPHSELYEEISRYPMALIDLAIVVDESVPVSAVELAIREACGDELESISLFDVYRGEQVSEARKSLAFSLGFSSLDHTLGDEEVAALRERAISAVRQECGAELRGA